jgi:hypothetical protein
MSKIRMFKWDATDSSIICLDAKSERTLAEFPVNADFPAAIKSKLIAYGLKQKLADSVSDVEGANEKIAGMSETYAMLIDGDWNRERTGGTRTVSVLVEALARIKGTSVGSIQKALQGYTDDQRAAMAQKPAVAKVIAEIKAEREEGAADLSDLE